MSRAAKSLLVFAGYVALTGTGFLLVPNILLPLLGSSTTTEPWIRVVGLLVLVLAYYYARAAGNELTEFLRWTVYGRGAVFVGFGALVVLRLAPPTLLVFGVVDLLGAIWTHTALRS